MAPSVQPDSGYGNVPVHHDESAAPASGPAFVVSSDEVLAKRAALLAEADNFQEFLDRSRNQLFMDPMGGDPVSQDVATAVTHRVRDADDSYYNVCQAWVNSLYQTADALAEVARRYGFTDDEIAASFRRTAPDA